MSNGTIIALTIMLTAFWIVVLDIRALLREIRDELRAWNRRKE